MSDDATVVAQLRTAGSDRVRAHTIEFYLYLPSEAAAREVADALVAEGFATEVRPGALGPQFLCLATRTMVPDVAALVQIRRRLDALAIRLGGEYDGWEAAVVR